MTKHLPEEAVEAAARAAFESDWPKDDWGRFKDGDHVRHRYNAMACAVLTAALPHLSPPGEEIGRRLPLPQSMHWLGDRHDAEATKHATDMRGCVLYFDRQSDCLEFMRRVSAPQSPCFAEAVNQAENEMLSSTERHGCQRCWSDDLARPCTCESERWLIKSAIKEVCSRIRSLTRQTEPSVTNLVHNVTDRRDQVWIGSWEVEPLEYTMLTDADVGRTVIYRDVGRSEAGTLTSWRNGIVFARYSRGDTVAGANPGDLVFGVRRVDNPDAPPSNPIGEAR